jgi:Ran GTPase-activating protein (RanGAP) involved in mRNA processing and transport
MASSSSSPPLKRPRSTREPVTSAKTDVAAALHAAYIAAGTPVEWSLCPTSEFCDCPEIVSPFLATPSNSSLADETSTLISSDPLSKPQPGPGAALALVAAIATVFLRQTSFPTKDSDAQQNRSDAEEDATRAKRPQFLYLDKCGIGPDGGAFLADALATNSTLQDLILDQNALGDAGATALARAIAHNQMLWLLDLRGNQVGNAGAAALADALQTNGSLGELLLANNEVGDDGASSFARALRHNRTLRTLDLRENNIGDAGAQEMVERLRFSCSPMLKVELEGNDVNLAWAIEDTIRDLHSPIDVSMDDAAEQEVAKLARRMLAEYDARGSPTKWTLKDTRLVDDMDRVESGGEQPSDGLLRARAAAVAFLQPTTAPPNLKELELTGRAMGDAGAAAVADALRHNSTLESLDLSSSSIQAAGSTFIADAMKENSALRRLRLEYNDVRGVGTFAIAEALRQNDTLTELILYGCQIPDQGALALEAALHFNGSLSQIGLNQNGLDHEIWDACEAAVELAPRSTGHLVKSAAFRKD